MGLVFFGGFEMGNLTGEFSSVDPPVVVGVGTNAIIAGGRSGAYQDRLPNYGGNWQNICQFNFPSALSEFYFQVALAASYASFYDSATVPFLMWRKGATVLGGIQYNFSTNQFDVYTGNFATLVGSFGAPPGSTTYYVLELHIKVDDSTGIIEIRKDMTTVLTFNGDTQPGADTTVDGISIGNLRTSFHYVDDFILNDPTGSVMNGYPGGLRIVALAPNTDDGTNAWTPSTAVAHYSTVDEVPPSAADYLSSAAADQVERFGLADLPGDALQVRAAKIITQARKDSGASPSRLAMGLTLAGGDHYSGDLDLPITAGQIVYQMLTNPETSNPFTVAEINSAKMIMKSRA